MIYKEYHLTQKRKLRPNYIKHSPLSLLFNIWLYTHMHVFWESFNLWHPLLIITYYHQTKTPISFWCRRGLNPRSLIQPSEILPIELTGTYHTYACIPNTTNICNLLFLYLLCNYISSWTIVKLKTSIYLL